MTKPQTDSPETVVATPRNRRQWTVVSYDIPDDKRRYKVMKTLEGYGRRVQYSVFECEVQPADLAQLQNKLHKLINEQEDDVRFYGLCEACVKKITGLGRAQIHRHRSHVVV